MNMNGLHERLKTCADRAREALAANAGFYLAVLALLVGILSGLGAVLFFHLIQFCNWLFFGPVKDSLVFLGPLRISLIGGLGGLLTGPLVYFLAREAKGHGVPEVMLAIARQGGVIRPRVVVIKAVASALTIGSGGSAGREGPIAQIGAALGSTIGQWLHIPERRLVTLVACGAGAGIAATFNTPLAGALFAMEVVLGEFTASTFGLVVISSVSAAMMARWLLGNQPVFTLAPYDLVHPFELILYALLGTVAAAVAILYSRLLYRTEDLFEALRKIPGWVQPALGGVLFGSIGVILPQTLGRGELVMDQVLRGEIALAWLLALLCIAKIITTSLTIGSGGSGGVFFPGLFIGVCMGGSLGSIYHSLLPGLTAGSGAYALVGMGALFAGMTQAPITAILMLFEMTQDYRIILPLMLACGIATLLARAMSKETIYTTKLARRGVHLHHGRDLNAMSSVLVRDAMSAQVDTVYVDATVDDALQLMQKTRHNGFPVVDRDEYLAGVIALEDVRRVEAGKRQSTPVRDAMTHRPVTVTPSETLAEASRKMALQEIGRLPVVGGAGLQVIGIITRSDIVRAYNRQVLRSEEPGG